MTSKAKKLLLPLLVGGVGLFSFLAGRSFTTNLPTSTGTNETPGSVTHTGTSAEEGGEGVETHGEERHDEHGSDEHGHGEETIVFEGNSAQEAGIALETVALQMQVTRVSFNGEVAATPGNVVRVSSVVPGRIVRLLAAPGDRVARGQTLAIIESRAIGEAQSAFQVATARHRTARANLDVVTRQTRAGVFARAPLEAARRTLTDAQAEVRAQEVALLQSRVALDNALELARAGSFAAPALDAARARRAEANTALASTQAALSNAGVAAKAAQAELARRRQFAASGAYVSRPVEEARRVLVSAQSARAAAQSEVATTRANLARARSLNAEGLVSGRDLEAAVQAFATAEARLETSQADEGTAQSELERQRRLASSNVANTAEVGAAQSQLAAAQSDARTRRAEVERAREDLRLAEAALKRESAIFQRNIANRREITTARAGAQNAQNALSKARQNLTIARAAYEREESVYRQDLNNASQVQAARSQWILAQADLRAAHTALDLLQARPGSSARVPLVAPIGGVVQERQVSAGEVLAADAPVLTLTDLSRVHVDFFLPERDISRVRVGAPVEVRVDAVPGRRYNGTVELIHTELDPKTRTVEAHTDLPNPDGALRIGMFARGQVATTQNVMAITVPAAAVQSLEGKQVVFVPGEEANTFENREVTVGSTQSGRTEIKSGLRPGERVVVKGAFVVKSQAMKAELGHED